MELHLPARAEHAADDRPVRLLPRTDPGGTRSRSPATTSAKGASAVQEVAFTLASGMAYVQAALDAGLKVDDFAPRLAFFFNGHNNVFQEVAKFRAARNMWRTLMKERFGAQDLEVDDAALPHADRRRHAHRPAAAEQHRPRRAAGVRGRLRRDPVAPHQRLRRGARAPDRARADRPPDPADRRPRVGRRRHRRPVRRLLLRRGADRRDRAPRVEADRARRTIRRLCRCDRPSSRARSRSPRSATTSATAPSRTSSSASTATSRTRSRSRTR